MQYIRIVVEESEDVEGRTKMTDKVIENNQVTVMGEVVSDFSYSHEIYGEGFYMVDLRCTRLSDSFDIIPVMVSERLLDVTASYIGMLLCVLMGSSGPITVMRSVRTDWYCLCLPER